MSVAGKPAHRLSFEEVPSENGSVPEVKKGTDADAADMSRMGKKQVLRVRIQVFYLTTQWQFADGK
jgi:choline transport protein